MRTLGLDTAFAACGVALVEDGSLRVEAREEMAKGQDARLAVLTRDTLAAADVSLDMIDRVVVIIGPGAFTGVRIGVAFARGLALALEIPALGATSLEATAPLSCAGPALAVLPAQRRPPDLTFWTQGFHDGAAAGPPQELGLADTASAADAAGLVFGSGLAALRTACPTVEFQDAASSAATAALRGEAWTPGEHPPRPVYVRAPDATPMAPR